MAALGALAASAGAATRYVATTGSDEAGNTCLSPAEPCRTVQQGIKEAEAGDTVSIGAGTYLGEFNVGKNLTLVGQGASTLLEGEPAVRRPVYLDADVSLEHLRIRGGLDGFEAMDAVYIGGLGTQVSFDDVTAEQAPGASEGRNGVYVGGEAALTMKNSSITGVGSTALWVSGSATVTESNVTVSSGTRGGQAVLATGGARIELIDSAITGTGERVSGLTSENGTVTATDSTFTGIRGIVAGGGSMALMRDKIQASEEGLVVREASTVSVRDSLIVPPVNAIIGTDVVVNRGAVPAELSIVGSTLYANGRSRYSGARAVQVVYQGDARVRIANSILRAVEPNGWPLDLEGEATWSISHSDFTTASGFGPPAPGSGTNLALVPLFVPIGSEYRLQPTSYPGFEIADPAELLPGETDLAGQPRGSDKTCSGIGPSLIGAYESVRPGRVESCPMSPTGGEGGTVGQRNDSSTEAQKSVPAAAPSKPSVTGVRVEHRRNGPILAFSLSEPAKVTVTVSRPIASGPGKRKKPSYRGVATIIEQMGAGAKEIALASRLSARKLGPGTYRLTLIATAEGLKSAARTMPLVLKKKA
jgi:hypothetical protein